MNKQTLFKNKWAVAEGFIQLGMNEEVSKVIFSKSFWEIACLIEQLSVVCKKNNKIEIINNLMRQIQCLEYI